MNYLNLVHDLKSSDKSIFYECTAAKGLEWSSFLELAPLVPCGAPTPKKAGTDARRVSSVMVRNEPNWRDGIRPKKFK